jgi:hypothetical protein
MVSKRRSKAKTVSCASWNVEHANACRLTVPYVLEEKRGYAMILCNIRPIHLILAPHIFQPLGDPIVVCRDPPRHRV